MSGLVQATVYGMLQGGLLAVLAAGFSLIWSITKIINVAYGEFVMIGAYLTWQIHEWSGLDPFLTVPVTMIVVGLLGYAVQRLVINLVVGAPVFLTLLLMFGIALVLDEGLITLYSGDYRSLTAWYSLRGGTIGGVTVPFSRFGAFVFSIGCTLGLAMFLTRTRTGLVLRAAGMNRVATRLTGTSVRHAYALAFAIGTGLAGAGGAMIATVGTFSPADGAAFTMLSFVVAVLGGIGNIGGVLSAAIGLGVVQSWAAYLVSGTVTNAVVFVLVVIVVLIRPQVMVVWPAPPVPTAGDLR